MNDDFAEYLTSQAQSDVASFHQFMILYDDHDNALHLFFEGDEDPSYYVPEVRRRAGNRPVRVYVCGGKRSVISVRNDIEVGGYSLHGCLFFIDRDYDSYLGTQDELHVQTYITDNYSIENDIVTVRATEIILVDVIGMSHADPDYVAMQKSILNAHKQFQNRVKCWMVWGIASKDAGEKPNFSNAKFGQLVRISASGDVVFTPNAFKRFRKSVHNATAVTRQDMVKWWRKIDGDDSKLWLRGKYELWLYESALISVLGGLVAKRKASKQRPPRIPSALRERTLFDLLGGRLQPPPSLVTFLDQRIPEIAFDG